jgi:NAD(P)-dependent dehydrogenase (short-subunit alcohol dehydrogenase family)
VKLQGNVVLLTGASRGLGKLIAQELGRRGARLALVARDKKGLDEVCQLVGSDQTFAIAADLSTLDGVRAAAAATFEHFGRVDVLVNNAGMTNSFEFLKAEPDALAKTVDLNLRALVVLTRLVAERMATQHSGYIVNMTSLAGVVGLTGEATYAATKAAVRLFTFSLRKELAPHGIRLTEMLIGPTETELLGQLEANRYVHGMFDNGRKLGFFVNLKPERVSVAVADAIVRETPLVVLPTRAWWTWLPLQGVARALSQLMTPS